MSIGDVKQAREIIQSAEKSLVSFSDATTIEKRLATFLPHWQEYYKQRCLLDGLDDKTARETALYLAKDLKEELKTAIESERIAELQADALRQLIRIANERIDLNEELIAYINGAKSKQELQEVIKYLHKNYKRAIVSTEEFLLLKRDEFVGATESDLFFWKALKGNLTADIEAPLLFDHFYDIICANMEVLGGDKPQQKNDPQFEAYHIEKMKKIIKPFLSPYYSDFHNVFIDSEGKNKHLEMTWKKHIEEKMLFCRERLRHFKEQLTEKDKIIFMSIDNPMFSLVTDMEKIINDAELLPSQIEKRAKNQNSQVNTVVDAEKKSYTETSHQGLGSALAKAILKGQPVFAQQLYGVEKNFEIGNWHRVIFYEMQKFLKALHFIERDFDLYRKEFNEQSRTVIFELSLETRGSEPLPDLKEETLTSEIQTEAAVVVLTEQEKKALVEQNEKIKRFKELQLARLNQWQKERQQETAQLVDAAEGRSLDIEQDPFDEEIEIKETTELKNFEIAQLIYIAQKIKSNFHVLQAIFAGKPIKANQLENLIKAASKGLKQDFSFFHFNGSSHFSAYIPNTHKQWQRVVKADDQEPYVLTAQKEMSTINGWLHSRESHNSGDLQPRVIKRCMEAFKRAGITPSRINIALQLGEDKSNPTQKPSRH